MAKGDLDTRELKDAAAGYLKKSKFEKAAEVLEQLVKAEPTEMHHRRRMGDCYRRLDEPERSIDQYQAAARSFAGQGQLIKGIAAVKVILEIDPENEEALQQLGEMNERRMGGKVAKAAPGVVTPKAISPVARPATAIEVAEGDAAEQSVGAAIRRHIEPIELDDDAPERPLTEKVPPAPSRGAQRGAMADRALQPQQEIDLEGGEELELDDAPRSFKAGRKAIIAPPPPQEIPDVPGEDPDADVEELPDDAILSPGPEELAASPEDELIVEAEPEPRRPPPAPPKKGAPAAMRRAVAPPIEVSLEPAPIADLLSSDAEEEIELLSVSSEVPQPEVDATGKDIEDAFGAIAPAHKRKVPAG